MMTESELAEAARRIASAEEKFLSTVTMLIEALDAVRDYLKADRKVRTAAAKVSDSADELMHSQLDALRELIAGMEMVIKGAGENNLAITENNERTKALLDKVESYFGNPAGLEYDN
jgi:ABC-type transporter Mla subunit MlaD